jgi:tRNA (guanine6-N2)-methyltransferase
VVRPRLIARSVRGLEWMAADEISERLPGAEGITLSAREIGFRVPALAPDVLGLRLADDLFLEVGRVADVGKTKDVPPAAARRVAMLDWAAAMSWLSAVRTLPGRPQFDVVVSLESRRNYNRFDLENAVGAVLRPVLSGSYLARIAEGRHPGDPDLTVRLFVRGTEMRVTLRLASRPLHRRPYKQDTGPGTLHPPVAAALARLAGPAAAETVADPFCGDGTIAVETALAYPGCHVLAGDIDPGRLRNARQNAVRAGVTVPFAPLDAGRLPWRAATIDAVVTNPPWNLSVDASGLLRSSLDRFWRQLSALLGRDGRLCLIADAGLDAPERLRRMRYQLALATQARLAGRVSHLMLCAPPGQDRPQVPPGLARWRRRALADGVVTDAGF